MFIVRGSLEFFAAPEERHVLMRIIAYNISLLRSSGLWVSLRVYKHSAPPELKRLVGARQRCVSCGLTRLALRSPEVLREADYYCHLDDLAGNHIHFARRRLTIREPTHIFGEHAHRLRYGHKKESSAESDDARRSYSGASCGAAGAKQSGDSEAHCDGRIESLPDEGL